MSYQHADPYDHSGFPPSRPPRNRARRRPIWPWVLVPIVVIALVVAVGALTRDEQSQATPVTTPTSHPTPTPPADTAGWQACQDLRELGAADLDDQINRDIGRQAQQSTEAEIAARGKELEDAVRRAADQNPIDGNLAISAAQVALRDACDQAFGPA
ncbi:hypothetical protein ACN27F_02235 [Solwaraspora sp. WMMB335]|uniref:hypothetical protein n=1 Tax=Solwaraspora sp. WMMB335 TaxID=3404118 RepID=UPI003B9469D1